MNVTLLLYLSATLRALLSAMGAVMVLSGCAFDASAPVTNVSAIQKTAAMTTRASGSFDVKIIPQATDGNDNPADTLPSRMLLDKQFHGDLKAVGKGQMLAAMTAFKGSACL